MGIEEHYPWQQTAWQQVQRYVQQQRIPQALLVKGQKGLGKSVFAQRFAHNLLCGRANIQGACGQCASCLLLKAGSHPDLFVVEADEGKHITVKQIRQLLEKLSLKPQFEQYRVVILNAAEQLNHSAANAFLKYLEEPNERTCLFLVTDRPSALPATIRSRCQQLTIDKPDQTTLLVWLKQYQIHDKLDVLWHLSQGAPLLAVQYAKDNHLELREESFKSWFAIAKGKEHPVLVAERWLGLPDTALLNWLTSWVMDLVKYLSTTNIQLLNNQDLAKSLQELSSQLELRSLYQLYDMLLASQQRLNTTINKQLLLEEILITWSTLTHV